MKKMFAFVLSMLFLFCLTSCSENDTKEVTSASSVASKAVSQAQEKEFSFGTTTANKYESNFLGLGAELGESWEFYTDDQIMTLNNLTLDMLDEDIRERLSEADVIYDMYAVNTDNAQSVNIVFEKLGLVNSVVMSEDQYIEATLADTALVDALESVGYTDITAEKSTATVGGKERKSIKITAQINGILFYEELACLKVGDYIGVITVASVNEDNTADIFAEFYNI